MKFAGQCLSASSTYRMLIKLMSTFPREMARRLTELLEISFSHRHSSALEAEALVRRLEQGQEQSPRQLQQGLLWASGSQEMKQSLMDLLQLQQRLRRWQQLLL